MKKLRRPIFLITIIFVLTCILTGGKPAEAANSSLGPSPTSQMTNAVAQAAPAKAEKKLLIRMTNEAPPNNNYSWLPLKWAELANAAMPGRFDFRNFPAGQLMKDKEAIDQLPLGNVEVNICNLGTFSGKVDPRISAIDLPFLWTSFEAMRKVVGTPIWEDVNAMAGAKGYKILTILRFSELGVSAPKRIHLPSDVKGKKIRGTDPVTIPPMFKQWGAHAMFLTGAEITSALETRVIDNVLTSTIAWEALVKDLQPYWLALNWTGFGAMVVSKKWWENLPGDVRKVLDETLLQATTWVFKETDRTDGIIFDKYAEGKSKYGVNRVTPEEYKIWRAAGLAAYPDLEKVFGKDLVQKAVEVSKTLK